MRDYYDILGVSKNADDKTIKRAYRKLAKKYHPDANPGDKEAEQKFKEVNEAYAVLGDPEKKKKYDTFGSAAFDQNGFGQDFGQGFGQNGNGYTYTYNFNQQDAQDIFGDIFGNMFGHGGRSRGGRGFSGFSGFDSSGFGNGFGGGSASYAQKGADYKSEITIGFDDAINGCERVFSYTGPDGRAQSLKVRIPAGMEDGKSIRLRGKGGPGVNGGEPGDILLKVNVQGRPGFERKGMDIYTTIYVPFSVAALGGKATVPTVNGRVICRIPEGTQSGSKIRLRGKGAVSMKDPSVHGDQYVVVQVQVPKNLTPSEKAKIKEMSDTLDRNGHGSAGSAFA
jgi:molecular chaperone DnaJ